MNIGLVVGVVGVLFCGPCTVHAQEEPSLDDGYVTKPLLILKSTRDYHEALILARKAARQLNLTLDLRDLTPDPKIGLTLPRRVCEDNGWDFPCYVARGRFDDGAYVSIEHSSSYPGFSAGYYIVLAASGKEHIDHSMARARARFPDAYSKVTQVYIGCMH